MGIFYGNGSNGFEIAPEIGFVLSPVHTKAKSYHRCSKIKEAALQQPL